MVLDECMDARSRVSCVLSDNALGGRLAAERVFRAGHRNLAFIGDFVADTVRARWEGFCRLAEKQAGARPVKYDIKGEDRLGDWESEIRAVVARLLRRTMRPTAVFCSCDAIARHAMRAFAEAGLSVPRDVSIVGFDDDPIAEWTTPALTTVRQDFGAMGREAVKALVARIEKPAAPGVTVKMPVELVERESLVRNAKKP